MALDESQVIINHLNHAIQGINKLHDISGDANTREAMSYLIEALNLMINLLSQLRYKKEILDHE